MTIIYDPKFKIAMNILKKKRIESGTTQQQMAEQLGCTQGYVSKYEQGQVRLDIIETRRVCECLNWSLSEYVNLLEAKFKELDIE